MTTMVAVGRTETTLSEATDAKAAGARAKHEAGWFKFMPWAFWTKLVVAAGTAEQLKLLVSDWLAGTTVRADAVATTLTACTTETAGTWEPSCMLFGDAKTPNGTAKEATTKTEIILKILPTFSFFT